MMERREAVISTTLPQRLALPASQLVVPNLAPPASQGSPVEQPLHVVDTELGGLFFLVNLALFLDLYGDFTQPRHVDLAMPLFDFIALLGQELTGGDDGDPVWRLLAELAGRAPDVPAARDFVPPAHWVIPDDWLVPFAGDAGGWTITAREGPLQLLHPAGFVAVETPYEPGAPSLARWRSWVVPYCRARLARAVGDGDLAPLWRRRARVFVTAARLDVEFSLHDHPIEVRIAGLDRDPGWLPGAGRDLRFHFR